MKAEEFKTQYLEKIYKEYSDTRSKSKYLFQEAQNYLPGGDTRTVTFFRPFPSFMVRGEGFNLYDVDGNEYIDFFNNATSLVLGHAHPKVVNAVLEQVKCGSVFASPLACQTKLAKILCDRLPSADRVRFCNSGTEATLTAIRAARAYRKKYKIMKMEGGYNGSCDLVEISVKPDLRKAGSINEPNAVPEDDSVSPGTLGECVIAPFNEPEIVSRLIEKHHDDLAAVIIEPMQGSCGMIPADFDFLKVCRDITTHFDIPLIFDEVQSFRLSPGGFQEICGVTPDITILGKIIGGGYPVGGVAGNKKYMDQFSPLNSSFLTHSGTFNGNPVTMVAGIATLSELQHSEIERINSLGANLREEFVRILKETGIIADVIGIGSMAQIHFTKEKVKGWRQAAKARVDIRGMLHLKLMNNGIFPSKRLMFNISTPMRETEIEKLTKALRRCLQDIKPYIEQEAPQLVI